MSPPSDARKTSVTATTAADPPEAGRLAILTTFALAANALPVPLLPDVLVARVRGAMAHDTVTRHGLSLTADARAALASPDGANHAVIRRAGEVLLRRVLRRLGPLAVLSSLTRTVEVYALGLLLDRYIERVRAPGAVRIDVEEARRVRDAIDRAVLHSLSPALQPSATTMRGVVDDLRTPLTRWVDTVLLTSASLPSYFERRLLAAFDEVARDTPGLRDG